MRWRRLPILILVAAALALALPLASCGKKSDPAPPKDQPQTYPGKYPSE
ncbi:MAG: hypothetical protein KGL11_05905 [Alphaproteobacteria bacterium]|nr:hypothetical protein [Alphaproteobacteria bacterium]